MATSRSGVQNNAANITATTAMASNPAYEETGLSRLLRLRTQGMVGHHPLLPCWQHRPSQMFWGADYLTQPHLFDGVCMGATAFATFHLGFLTPMLCQPVRVDGNIKFKSSGCGGALQLDAQPTSLHGFVSRAKYEEE
jgi:hypothetical protein